MIEKQGKPKHTDVLIVGAGPAGLMMACQLAIHNVSFRIIDKLEHFKSYSGALLIQARTLEIFDQMGIVDKVLQRGKVVENVTMIHEGREAGTINIGKMGSGISRFPYILMLKQAHTRELLFEFLKERGIQIENGTRLEQFSQDVQFVDAILTHTNGKKENLKANYLIGADGIYSHVRSRLGIRWEGSRDPVPLFVTDCHVNENPGSLGKASAAFIGKPASNIIFSISQKTIAGFFPLEGKGWRIDGLIPEEITQHMELDFEDATQDLAKRLKMNFSLSNPDWFSVFYPNTYLASTYHIDKCFLVGDAAHVHTPIGAQGMNTGVQDSFNLAWKMAFVLKHGLSEKILNTYTSERRPIAEKLIQNTDKFFWLAIRKDRPSRFLRNYIVPWSFRLFDFLLESESLQRAFFRRISQISVGYGSKASWAGKRWPFIKWTDEKGNKTDTHDLLKCRKFVLIIFHKEQSIQPKVDDVFQSHLQAFKMPVRIETIVYSRQTKNFFQMLKLRKNGYFLVRPDGYIALNGVNLDFGPVINYFKNLKLSDG